MFENIELIVYDFDGVMTDNRVMVDQNGNESVMANRGDGYGVGMIKKLGIRQVILSTEVNPVVEMRAKKLNLEVIHGVSDKRETLVKFCADGAVSLDRVMFLGNDLNDIEAMRCVGIKGAPKDAEPEILEIADWISEKNGGYGVVRELARLITLERNV
jgi:YrbI family 3-deoxy-D-manno-octulosonate 8-phosphate phosphatase